MLTPRGFVLATYFTINVKVIGFNARFFDDPEGIAVGVTVRV